MDLMVGGQLLGDAGVAPVLLPGLQHTPFNTTAL